MASIGLAASGVGLLSTIFAVLSPLALGLKRSCVGSWEPVKNVLAGDFKRKLNIHDQISVLAESKLNSIADNISAALHDENMSEEEFRLSLSEIDKYDQMKAGIRGRQRQGLSEDEKRT